MMDYLPHIIYAAAVLLLLGLVYGAGAPGHSRRAILVFLLIALAGGLYSIHIKYWRQTPDPAWRAQLDALYEEEAAAGLIEIRPDGEIVISPELMRRMRDGRGLSEEEMRRLREQMDRSGLEEDAIPPELTP